MTIFTVVWTPQAENELIDIWLASHERAAVTEATTAIDRELRVDPNGKGEELHEGLRAFQVFPLRVLFEIHVENRIVKVLRVTNLA